MGHSAHYAITMRKTYVFPSVSQANMVQLKSLPYVSMGGTRLEWWFHRTKLAFVMVWSNYQHSLWWAPFPARHLVRILCAAHNWPKYAVHQLTSSPFFSVLRPDQKRWAQTLTARHWSGFFSSLEAASAHWVLRGSWFSSLKQRVCSKVPMMSIMAASWAFESLISSSYREKAWLRSRVGWKEREKKQFVKGQRRTDGGSGRQPDAWNNIQCLKLKTSERQIFFTCDINS